MLKTEESVAWSRTGALLFLHRATVSLIRDFYVFRLSKLNPSSLHLPGSKKSPACNCALA